VISSGKTAMTPHIPEPFAMELIHLDFNFFAKLELATKCLRCSHFCLFFFGSQPPLKISLQSLILGKNRFFELTEFRNVKRPVPLEEKEKVQVYSAAIGRIAISRKRNTMTKDSHTVFFPDTWLPRTRQVQRVSKVSNIQHSLTKTINEVESL